MKDIPADYNRPRAYVRYHRLTDDEWKTTLEYVCDQEDEAWLQKNAKFGGGGGNASTDAAAASSSKPKLSIDLLERMMDALEKETAFDAIITVGQADALFRNKIPELYLIFPSKPRQGQVTTKHVLNDVYGVRKIVYSERLSTCSRNEFLNNSCFSFIVHLCSTGFKNGPS